MSLISCCVWLVFGLHWNVASSFVWIFVECFLCALFQCCCIWHCRSLLIAEIVHQSWLQHAAAPGSNTSTSSSSWCLLLHLCDVVGVALVEPAATGPPCGTLPWEIRKVGKVQPMIWGWCMLMACSKVNQPKEQIQSIKLIQVRAFPFVMSSPPPSSPFPQPHEDGFWSDPQVLPVPHVALWWENNGKNENATWSVQPPHRAQLVRMHQMNNEQIVSVQLDLREPTDCQLKDHSSVIRVNCS